MSLCFLALSTDLLNTRILMFTYSVYEIIHNALAKRTIVRIYYAVRSIAFSYNADMASRQKKMTSLTLGALGVVFGDIGTSPLYALKAAFSAQASHSRLNKVDITGIVSLIIWSLLLVVTVKFIIFIMRANNGGEGGILALVALIKNGYLSKKYKWILIGLGIIGVSLFYGDSVITPAISVLSSVEGLKVVYPGLQGIIIPVSIVILAGLFWIQRYGTAAIGRLFGPVMMIWFLTIAMAGLAQVIKHPVMLQALSPFSAIYFFYIHPALAFLAMTAVVLAITGAEALYADMGHFGRAAISKAWLIIVFPALILSYMGQGAFDLYHPNLVGAGLVDMIPGSMRVAFIILSTLATLIASQSVISGAFSLTRQAIQLNFLPKLLIRYTSSSERGQIYLPFINFLLFVLVICLVILFGSSVKLANAYGIAVSGTLAADTILFLVVMRANLHSTLKKLIPFGLLFIPIDLLFVTANFTKILHGGIFPILIAVLIIILIDTWTRGERIIALEREQIEGSLQEFVNQLHFSGEEVKRAPGATVFIGHHPKFTPLALRATVDKMHEISEKSVILTVQNTAAAHVEPRQRAQYFNLSYEDGLSHLILSYGFHDKMNIPADLKAAQQLSTELDFNLKEVTYIISSSKVVVTKKRGIAHWRKKLYILMVRNANSSSDYYNLPIKQVEEIDTILEI
jgi:KUP system potassium uptake protein